MTSPVPGVTYPNPRTWAAGDFITTPRLRGDMTNLAALYAGGARVMMAGKNESTPALTTGTATLLNASDTVFYLNSWNIAFPSGPQIAIPFAGWYLAQGCLTIAAATSSSNQYKYAMGFEVYANGALTVNIDGGSVPADGNSGHLAGPAGLDLYQFNEYANTADTISWYAYTNNPSPGTLNLAFSMLEWVGLPTTGLTGYTGPYGTVVASPVAAAAFPSGQGTYITNGGGISAGATSMTVHDATGMIVNGTLGLDYINGQPYANGAEAVTITSVAGTTIGISATGYAHLQNAPVAVPYSYALLNQQCRDLINFLAYPPMLRAVQNQAQSIASTGFPPTVGGNPGNQVTLTDSPGGCVDNFSGFSSSAYTVPVAGVYLVYGQVYYAGAGAPFGYSAGVSVNSGTIQWGALARSNTPGALSMCATFRRLMRFSKNDVVTLWAYQGSGSNMNTDASGSDYSRLVMLFRGF